ncbi:MAG: MFS transporter [Bdellovibrionia bacterium]
MLQQRVLRLKNNSDSRGNLNIGLIEAFFSALMVGAGETYLPAYVLSAGLGEIFAGILSTLPILSGAVIQLFAPKMYSRMKNPKKWVVLTVLLQALAFIPLIYFTLTRSPDFWSLFLVLSLYWAAGFASGPAWNYWMGRLVDPSAGGVYFAKRAQVTQLGILLGLILGGVALHNKVELLPFTSVFTSLFVLAFLSRIISTLLLSQQSYLKEWQDLPRLGFRDSLKTFWSHSQKKKFFLLLVPYQASVFITGPFVIPYFLAQIKMDYGTLMVAVSALFVGKIMTLQLAQRVLKHVSPQKIFLFGAASVAPLPMLWAFSTEIKFILLLQFVSGMSWALIEYGLSLVFFKDLNEAEKVPFTMSYNFLNSLAILGGTFVGSQVLFWLGTHLVSYKILFFVGGFFRILFCGPLLALSSRTIK